MTPETLIKKEIKDWLKLKGWFSHHFMAGLGCYPGTVDLIAMRNGVVLLIEVKTPKGKQSKKQIKYQENVEKAGCNYVLASSYKDIEQYLRWSHWENQ